LRFNIGKSHWIPFEKETIVNVIKKLPLHYHDVIPTPAFARGKLQWESSGTIQMPGFLLEFILHGWFNLAD